MHKIQSTKFYIILLIVFTIGTVFFRYSFHNENKVYKNYGASYHVLLTVKALIETPITQHHFLPIVSLGGEADKKIRWGATIPDEHGNYYYTSFPQGGFVFPYVIFKLFNLDVSINSLFVVSSFILLISVLLIFILTRKVSEYLDPLINNNIPALLVAVIYLFSLESLYSHGYIYWAHSLMQPVFIFFLYLMFKTLIGQQRPYYLLLMFVSAFLLGFTEWSGYLIVFGGMVALVFSSMSKKKKYFYLAACAVGAISALSVFILAFLSIVEFDAFFQALESRFMARSITADVPISMLFSRYWESYNTFLLLVPLVFFFLLKDVSMVQDKKRYALFGLFVIVLFGMLENIIMKQHAIAYHFDRLKVLAFFPLIVPILWQHKNKLVKVIVILIILISAIYSCILYPTQRISEHKALTENIQFVKDYKFQQECSSCILGMSLPVRGYSNLLFNRGIYELRSSKVMKNIAFHKNTCACHIDANYIDSAMIHVLGYEKFDVNDHNN